MRDRLNIGIATAGRFHVLDLARDLHALGHNVKFYSYVPRSRARKFGLPDECQVPLTTFALPSLAWQQYAPDLGPKLRESFQHFALDNALKGKLQPCDVLIFMSGIYLEAAWHAKKRFGARLWLHRGSKHVLVQDEIMAELPGAERASARVIRRELAGYALADRIVVPSRHSDASFDRPADRAKLFRNAYGVSLSSFPDVSRQRSGPRLELLFVGTWCLRKGCDVLVQAIRTQSDIRLTHVGRIGDVSFPTADSQFNHVDAVDQLRLKDFYANADALVLPSREEGFGLVLPQALASGLPIICTDQTGGPDLAHTSALAERIIIMPAGDVGAMVAALCSVRDRLRGGSPFPRLTEADRQTLSWRAYAERHAAELIRDWRRTRPLPAIRRGSAGEAASG